MLGIEPQRLESIFSIMIKIKWINCERYREGTLGLLKECVTKEELDVTEYILSNLKYCTSTDLDESATHAANAITDSWSLTPSNSILVGVAEPSKPCGSSAYVRAIQNKLHIDWEPQIFTSFVSAFRHRNGAENLIIVDDFIGTGKKISDRLDRLLNNPNTSDFRVHVCSFAGMDEGLTRIADIIENRIHVHIALDKCISHASPTHAADYMNSMNSLEKNIFANPGKYSLGYKQSEAAFYLEAANIPNNNFPILWWEKYADERKRPTLFSRR